MGSSRAMIWEAGENTSTESVQCRFFEGKTTSSWDFRGSSPARRATASAYNRLISLIAEDFFQGHLLHGTQGSEEVHIQVFGVSQNGIMIGTALDPLGVGGAEVIHREGIHLLKDLFLTRLAQAQLFGSQIAVKDTLPFHALGTELTQNGSLGDFQVLGCLRQGFNNLIEAFAGLFEFVVLRGNVGPEGIGIPRKGGI